MTMPIDPTAPTNTPTPFTCPLCTDQSCTFCRIDLAAKTMTTLFNVQANDIAALRIRVDAIDEQLEAVDERIDLTDIDDRIDQHFERHFDRAFTEAIDSERVDDRLGDLETEVTGLASAISDLRDHVYARLSFWQRLRWLVTGRS